MRPIRDCGTSCQPCFNPRICKRCDNDNDLSYDWFQVSIHASVKDATLTDLDMIPTLYVSIHASVKDATGWDAPIKQEVKVSIHASVKDAT